MEKITYKCGSVKNYATCIEYQNTISANTNIVDTSCVSVDEVIKDLYQISDSIILKNNFESVVALCGTLPTIKSAKNLIQYLITENCNRLAEIQALQQTQITQNQQIIALQQNICA